MREARILAQIDHPNIATVFDVGRDRQSGLYYFAMEYVPHSVEQVLEVRGRLSADRAVRVAQEAASALEAARQAGITHHDVKPENLLLTSLEASGAVKLIDFGIARAGDSGGTQAGALWGYAVLHGSGAVAQRSRRHSVGRVLPGGNAVPAGVRKAAVRLGP